jgi:UDP-N-acetylglucosamine 3-dehydrogenase
MSDQRVRVGLIGCGNIGASGHLPAYTRIPEAELVAVCDTVEKAALAAAESSGAIPTTDHHQLLQRADIEMVDICVPTYLHAELAVAAMQAGKHVLCEKPMAHSLEAADSMIEAARQSRVKLMIGHVRRFDHRYTSIKEQLDAGKVGHPVFIRRAERQFLPFPPEAWQWNPGLGGGVILDVGVHATDLFGWLLGRKAVQVYAVARAVREAARAARSYDHAFMTIQFQGGRMGFAEASWAYPEGFGGTLYAQLDVVGTAGKIQYADKDTNPMLIYAAGKGHELPRYFRFMSTTEFAFEEEIRHFVRCVLDDREPAVSSGGARAALELALAAQRSAEMGQPVQLPLGKEAG